MLGKGFWGVVTVAATLASVFIISAGPVAARSDVPTFANESQQADWRQFRGSADHRGWNSSESILSTSNVGSLQLRWSVRGGFNSSPAVANGVVYNGDADLGAYGPDCATGGSCDLLWHGGTGYPDWASPAVGGGYVYMQSDGGLYAFKVGCRADGETCSPVWMGTSAGNAYTSPTFANGWVYVATTGGQIQAYDTARCLQNGTTCAPDWVTSTNGLSYSSPAVTKGAVYAVTADGMLEAFPARCGTGGATCSPTWVADLHIADQVEASPAVANGVVYIVNKEGLAFAFGTNCSSGGGTCSPMWSQQLQGHTHSSPAATDTTVYFASGRRVYAFSVGCISSGQHCRPLWRSGRHPAGGNYASSPAVANGVLYIGTQGLNQSHGRLMAFDANCATDGRTCKAIWRSDFLGSMVNSSPAVAHGQVYVASNGGTFYAFSLPTP